MFVKMSEKLYLQLKSEIAKVIAAENDPFKTLSSVLRRICSVLKDLKDYILKNPFKNESEQISFFKHIKPKFYCLRIYYLKKYNVETSLAAGDTETLKNFYRAELKAGRKCNAHLKAGVLVLAFMVYQYHSGWGNIARVFV
jgi:hypothetical protein